MADSSNGARTSPLLSADGTRPSARDVELIPQARQSDDAGVDLNSIDDAASVSSSSDLCRRNIRAMFVFQFLSAVAWGTAMGPVFDRYLYLLGTGWARGPRLYPVHGANSLVGVTESVSGITSLIMAIPVGLVVDKNPQKRARLLRASMFLGLMAAVSGVVAVLSDEIIILTVMLVLFGAFSELSNSAAEAIFADSIPAGERSSLFVTKAILSTVGSACGPGLSALMLWLLGDEWQPYQVKTVIMGGLLLMVPTVVPLYLFGDPPQAADVEKPPAQPQEAGGDSEQPQNLGGQETSIQADADNERVQEDRRFGPLRSHHVPILLAFSDFLTCVGAGMTVKFFNLFFIQDQHFSPVAISLLQTVYPVNIAIFMKFTERLAKPLGRAQASLLFFSCNVLCLFMLAEVTWLPILLLVFLVRGAFANSTYPIDRSILMDFTPSSQRGLWNSIESLTSMTWSGSAFIGGLLSDAHDYRFTFFITGLVYAIACCFYLPLLWLVPRKEQDAAHSGRS